MKKLSLLCAVLLLSACHSSGGGGGGGGAGGGAVPPPPPPATVVDAFVTAVSQYFGPTGEDTDATPIESVVATEPEDSEPSDLT
jgi:hypothetical protein